MHAGMGASAGAIVAAGACIPNLPPDQPLPEQAPVVDLGNCGDGYINLAAGEECDPAAPPDGGSLGCNAQCKVVCPGLRWSLNNHCYELMSAAASALQGGASSRCATFQGGGHVVTFASEGELDAVARYLADADAGPFWVGLWEAPDKFNSVNAYEPGWSATCPGCYAHTPDPRDPLPRSAETVADPTALDCVAGSSDLAKGSWAQYPCSGSAALRVVCEHEPDGVHSKPCEAGICLNLVATYGAKAYVYQSSPLPWLDAEAQCRGLGGTLVVLGSRDEREQLWLELSRLSVPPPRVWIGLAPGAGPSGDASAPTWRWDDGTSGDAPDAHPPPWGVGQPAGSTPAFLYHSSTQPPIDDTLARTDSTIKTLPYVCQLLADAGK